MVRNPMPVIVHRRTGDGITAILWSSICIRIRGAPRWQRLFVGQACPKSFRNNRLARIPGTKSQLPQQAIGEEEEEREEECRGASKNLYHFLKICNLT